MIGAPAIAGLRSVFPSSPVDLTPSTPPSVTGYRRSGPTLPARLEVCQGEQEACYDWPDLFDFNCVVAYRMAHPEAPSWFGR